MAKARLLNPTEYEDWNQFVDKSDQGSVFSKTWWLSATTNNNFEICICEGDGEIFSGMSLPFYKSRSIRMPMLTQSLGILFVEKPDTKLQKKLTNQKEQTNQIFEVINGEINKIDINFHYNYYYWLPLFWLGLEQTTRYTYIIDYKDFNEDEYFIGLSKGHKWVINKARRNNKLSIVELNDIDAFYAEAEKTYARKGVAIGYSLEQLKHLDAVLQANNARKIFAIKDDEENIHAVNYYIYDKNEVYYWLGASDEKLRDSGAHTYLIWHAIKYFSDKTKRFNFGGSMMEEVEKNFRNFGATPTPYFRIYNKSIKLIIREILKRALPKAVIALIKNK